MPLKYAKFLALVEPRNVLLVLDALGIHPAGNATLSFVVHLTVMQTPVAQALVPMDLPMNAPAV